MDDQKTQLLEDAAACVLSGDCDHPVGRGCGHAGHRRAEATESLRAEATFHVSASKAAETARACVAEVEAIVRA